jgi:hypothetical protein
MKQLVIIVSILIMPVSTWAAPAPDSGSLGISVSGFANLSSAVASPTTMGKPIIIDRQITVNSMTVPNNRELKFINGGIINVAAKKVLTINSPVSIGRFKVFTGSGSVAFGPGSIDEIMPEWWCGINAADSTAALRTAIKIITAPSSHLQGRTLSLSGVYNISDDLPIPINASGWKIKGTSRRGTVIRQLTNNKPIFSFPGGNCSEFEISDLNLTWAHIQPATNTQAIAFNMNVSTSQLFANYGVYNFSIRDCFIENGFRGIFGGSDTHITAVWGADLHNISFKSMSGSAIKLEGGAPNNRINGIYIIGPTGTEPLISLLGQQGLNLDNVEVNNNFYSQPVLKLAQCRGRIGSVRAEVSTFTANSYAFDISNCWLRWDYAQLLTTKIDTGGGKWFVFYNTGLIGSINLGTLEIASTTVLSGIPLVLNNNDGNNTLTIDQVMIVGSQIPLTDLYSTTGADGLYVNSWNLPKTSSDNGDTNKTLIAADRMIQRFSTTLTANRTVTLPSEFAKASDLFAGKEFTIVRDAIVPGAYTLQISGDKPIVTLPSGVRSWVRIIFERYTWRVVGYGMLP